ARWQPDRRHPLPAGLGPFRRRRAAAALREAEKDARRIAAQAPLRKHLMFEGVDLSPLLEPRLARAADLLSCAAGVAAAAERILPETGTRLVASVYFSSPLTHGVAVGARRAGIPVVTMQHSSYGESPWPIARWVDGVMSDWKLVGGEGTAEHVRKREASGATPVATGMPRLDGLLARARAPPREGPVRVVYPLTGYVKNRIMYAGRRTTLTEYFSTNRRILEALAAVPGASVLVRPHPAAEFRASVDALTAWARDRGMDNVAFRSGGSAHDEFCAADLVVVDSPSTVLLDAATAPTRLAVFNGVFDMLPEALDALRLRVSLYGEDIDSFVRDLPAVVAGARAAPPPDDTTFLRMYATHLHDGRSGERASEALRRIARGEA
ncbi:MAG TPA: hypothetical protein VHH36_05065, partial [Candidatus Thermoplasmatota archaeon]|nr:hypothetical protein [Candidatus Thermoplasmatota archaeon]